MIQLSNKTADWIAKVAREELIKLQDISHEIDSDINELDKSLEKACRDSDEELRNAMINKRNHLVDKAVMALQEEKDKWNRIVELMLTGEKDGRD